MFGRLRRFMAAVLLQKLPTRFGRWNFYAPVFTGSAIYCFLELRPSITGHPTSSGFAIAALAVAAVVMAARADKFIDVEKFLWIIVCSLLFNWELDTIDQEHSTADHQHIVDMNDLIDRLDLVQVRQDKEFKATVAGLATTTNAFARNAAALEKSIKIGQSNFLATVSRLDRDDQEEKTRFDLLESKEQKLVESETLAIKLGTNLPQA